MLALDPNATVSSSAKVNPGVVEVTSDKPDGFDQSLWDLLQAVKTAGIPLVGKIAEYAGFYIRISPAVSTEWDPTTDNGNYPDQPQTWTNQPNKSLDKLTFLIMFRLPFRGEVVTVSPPLVDPGLDLYNSRKIAKRTVGLSTTYVLGAFHDEYKDGKFVTTTPQLCTITRDPGATSDIEGMDLFYDEPTKSYYVGTGAYLAHFGDPMANPSDSPDPHDPQNVTGTWSRRANIIRQLAGLKRLNGGAEQVALVAGNRTTVDDSGNPISFDYNGAATPNSYDYYGIDFSDLYPGESPPETVGDPSITVGIKTVPLYYFLTVYTENRPGKFDRSAHFPENKVNPVYGPNGVLWHVSTPLQSGLTLGFGYDLGAHYPDAYAYTVIFNIQKRTGATGNVTLSYVDRPITVSLTSLGENLKKTIADLIDMDEALIKVEDFHQLDPGYAAGWTVTIKRRMTTNPKSKRFNVYSFELKYSPAAGETTPKLSITPAAAVRYHERTTGLPLKNYQTFLTLLDKFFAPGNLANPGPNPEDAPLKGFDAETFKDRIKSILGLKAAAAGIVYWNNETLFKAFRMPPWLKTFTRNYQHVFSDEYYTQQIETDYIIDLIQPGALPNVLDKTLLATVSYGGRGHWVAREYKYDPDNFPPAKDGNSYTRGKGRNDPGIILAISSHNQYELANAFRSRNRKLPRRQKFLIAYVKKFQRILNRGVEA